MTTQQTDRLGEIDIAISKLQVPIHKLLLGLPDELEAAKDEPSSGYGEFNREGELEYHPDHKVMSLVGMAALLAARYDVVSKGEGVELMGLWYELDTNESDTDELDTDESDTDGLEAGELKEWRAAVAFHAMMKRMRWPGWAEIKTLEECLQAIESAHAKETAFDGEPFAPTLDDIEIMRVLEESVVVVEQGKLVDRMPRDRRLGEKTISNRLAAMREAGLARCPHGDRKGWTITDKGRTILKAHLAIDG